MYKKSKCNIFSGFKIGNIPALILHKLFVYTDTLVILTLFANFNAERFERTKKDPENSFPSLGSLLSRNKGKIVTSYSREIGKEG